MSSTQADDASVADLAGDFVRAVLGVGRSAARMFGFELRDVTRRLGRRIALLIVSAVFAAVGILLVLGSGALLAEAFLRVPLWAGTFALGIAAVGAGALGLRTALRRLGDRDLAFPETVSELGKDVEALTRSVEQR